MINNKINISLCAELYPSMEKFISIVYICCNPNMKEIIVIIRTFLFFLGSSCAALACHLVCLGFELSTPSQHISQPDLHQFV